MNILMRNIGMTLHVIHKLRAQGIDNVQVNMDWQHLIMNGENLAEYAALLAAEGLLGHQHANSGWGTFDDDNILGATRFMETLELAVELRRAGYGEGGERLGFDLYPYTEDAVEAVRRSVLQLALHRLGRRAARRRRSCARRRRARTPCARTSSSTARWGRRRDARSRRSRSSRRCSRRRPARSRCSSPTSTASSSPPRRWTSAAPDTRLNAQRKAYTAARSDAHSTGELADKVRGEPAELASFDPFFTFFRGGVAAFEGERRVGAVGVSGLPGEQDEALARRGLAPCGPHLRGVTALVGLDVGTSGVKAVAVSPDGEVLARAERRLPAVHAAAGVGRAGPRGLVARRRGGARGGRRLDGARHRALGPDARPRPARRGRPRPPPRDPLERPAHRGRVRRDRGAARPRAAHRPDREPRADRASRRPKLLWVRRHEPDVYRAHRARPAAEGLRAPAPDRRARDRRRRRVGDAPLRRRRPALERRDARGARACRPRGCRRRSSRRRCPAEPRAACPWPPGPATRRRARSASASTGRAGCRSCSAPRASSSPRCPSYAADPQARVHVFCHAVPGRWHAMGVMLSAAGSLAWLHDRVAPEPYERLLNEAERWPPGRRGAPVRAVPRRRADAARRPGRARRLRRAPAPPRPRRARPRRARRRGLRAAGLPRPARASSASSPRPAASRAAARGASLWLRIVASALGLPLERTAVEEGAAYGAALLGGVAGGVFADAQEAVAARASACATRSSPTRRGARRTRSATRASEGSTRPFARSSAVRPQRDFASAARVSRSGRSAAVSLRSSMENRRGMTYQVSGRKYRSWTP